MRLAMPKELALFDVTSHTAIVVTLVYIPWYEVRKDGNNEEYNGDHDSNVCDDFKW